jgi:hypothetical protein
LALSVHESALQIQRCAGLKKVGLLLGQFLKHSKKRTQELMRTLEMDEFVGMPPDISPKSDTEAEIVAPNFTRVKREIDSLLLELLRSTEVQMALGLLSEATRLFLLRTWKPMGRQIGPD